MPCPGTKQPQQKIPPKLEGINTGNCRAKEQHISATPYNPRTLLPKREFVSVKLISFHTPSPSPLQLHPKYITIRDMYFLGHDTSLRWEHVNDIINKLNVDKEYINQFECFHGSIATVKGMLHFLMKYQWKDNGWKQELNENYFSWDYNELTKIIGSYEVLFEAYYLLPYYAEKWRNLDIDPSFFRTHAQFILRREK